MKTKLMIAIEEKRHWRIKYHDLFMEKENEIRVLKENMKRMCEICELQRNEVKVMDIICWKTKDGRKGECEIDDAKKWIDKYSSTIPDVEYWVKNK